MAKYKVNYTEIFRRSFIVEAESEEEAQEKWNMRRKILAVL